MADAFTLKVWFGRGTVLLIALVLVFIRLLPLNTGPGGFPAPDLLLCVVFAWVLRRPDHIPPLLVATVFLLCDFVFLRPPGLWAALVLAATEFLRGRQGLARELPFPFEWAMVSVVLVVATLAESIAMTVFFVPGGDIGLALLQTLTTLAVYPIVVASLWLGLGLRRAAPGEVDDLGRRI